MSLAEIAAAVNGELCDVADPAVTVTAVAIDSRAVTPGALFVALPGSTTDGQAFAPDAIRAGAAAAVVRSAFGGPAVVVDDPLAALGRLAARVVQLVPDLRIVGVTGSNGKTTTKDLVATLLAELGPTVAAPSSYNGEVGLPLSVLRADMDTKYLALEYGARGIGHIRDLARIARPDIAVVLGVGVAHVGVFGSTEAIATAKAELVEALTPDGLAVLNADDPTVAAMRDRTKARVVTFGRYAEADISADDIALDELGRAGFLLTHGGRTARVQLQLHGEHQVANALAAAGVATACGLSVDAAAAALSSAVASSKWRMEVVAAPDGVTLINDAYNANPDSMAAGLRALVALAAGRRTWAVLGPMGELGAASSEAHRDIGRLVAELGIDRVVVIGPGASPIAETAKTGSTTVDAVPDIAAAVSLLRSNVTSGDVVLVKASRSAGLERVADALVAGTVPA